MFITMLLVMALLNATVATFAQTHGYQASYKCIDEPLIISFMARKGITVLFQRFSSPASLKYMHITLVVPCPREEKCILKKLMEKET